MCLKNMFLRLQYFLQKYLFFNLIFGCSVAQSVQLFVTPWTAARQASLSFTISRSLLKFMFIESVMPSNRLILCRPLLFPPSIFASVRVFSSESALCISWPKGWKLWISPKLKDQSFQ